MSGVDFIEVPGDVSQPVLLRLGLGDGRTVAECRMRAEARLEPLLGLLLQQGTRRRRDGCDALAREIRAVHAAAGMRGCDRSDGLRCRLRTGCRQANSDQDSATSDIDWRHVELSIDRCPN